MNCLIVFTQEPSPAPQLKVSILQHSVFFVDQLSYSYMTTGKTIAFTSRTFVGKVMSLLFNMLSRFVVVFLKFSFMPGLQPKIFIATEL